MISDWDAVLNLALCSALGHFSALFCSLYKTLRLKCTTDCLILKGSYVVMTNNMHESNMRRWRLGEAMCGQGNMWVEVYTALVRGRRDWTRTSGGAESKYLWSSCDTWERSAWNLQRKTQRVRQREKKRQREAGRKIDRERQLERQKERQRRRQKVIASFSQLFYSIKYNSGKKSSAGQQETIAKKYQLRYRTERGGAWGAGPFSL